MWSSRWRKFCQDQMAFVLNVKNKKLQTNTMSAGRKKISEKKDWNTPPKYVKLVNDMFPIIELDPCSNISSMINSTNKYILPIDGLKESWDYKTIFVNPPYGKNIHNKTSIYDWINKGVVANKKGSELLYLIPVATNTRHFKDLIFKNSCGICFLNDTRLKFWSDGIEDKKGAPMSCCIVYFGKDYDKFQTIFNNSGMCFKI